MEKFSGLERVEDLPEKVLLLYRAVGELLDEGADLSTVKVSAITSRAGIGKGTAYDYFETKEDMIASALVYLVKYTLLEMQEEVDLRINLTDQVTCILEMITGKTRSKVGMMRFVHMMTDPTPISCMFRDKIQLEQEERYHPISMMRLIVEKAIRQGEISDRLPMHYMVYALSSRIITYMTYLAIQEEENEAETAQMREYICTGLLKEFS
jgi:AcrR family transcriptional regulator